MGSLGLGFEVGLCDGVIMFFGLTMLERLPITIFLGVISIGATFSFDFALDEPDIVYLKQRQNV